jgi:hypothetical protein
MQYKREARLEHTAICRKERGVYAASTILSQRCSSLISGIVNLCALKRRKRRAPLSKKTK